MHEHNGGVATARAAGRAPEHPLLDRTVGAMVAGEEVLASAQEAPVLDPSIGRQVASVQESVEVDEVVAVAAAAQPAWQAVTPVDRARALYRVAALLRERSEELALLDAVDAGLPLTTARGDVELGARYFEFYAGAADKLTGTTIPLGDEFLDLTVRDPWGVCAIVQPFNFPVQLLSRSVAAALATGNAVVVKSADRAPLTSVALAALVHEAGVLPGALNVIHGGASVGAELVGHPAVDHVTFTGSTATGRRIMEACARNTTPLTLELGGKSPQIVLDERYVEPAAESVAKTLFRTSGQACAAASRLLVRRGLREHMAAAVVAQAESLRVGDALADRDMGPLVSERQLENALAAVAAATGAGAKLLTGGVRLSGDETAGGFFLGPTVLSDVEPTMLIAQEETFAPVVTIIEVADADEALTVANGTEYGLVASVWSADTESALRLARRLQAGQVFVNTYGAGVEVPFGGYKRSGFGRAKGMEALLEYTQVKNICLATP